MLRLAAAHRGAVRAIQGFVNQQLPLQDLRRGLPTGYHELALLIRQLALVSTQIKADKDTSEVHEDLLKMLDRVDVSAWFSLLTKDIASQLGPSINGLVTDGNTKLYSQLYFSAISKYYSQ